MKIERQTKIRVAILGGLIICLTLAGTLVGLAWPLLQVQAGPTLPSRDRPAPDSPPDSDDDDGEPPGAYIELQTQPPQINLWSMVQWQDSDGNWHNVDGWQGRLNGNGSRRWWVSPRDFGKGPFRWRVVRGPNEPVVGESAVFNLPDEGMEVMIINVTVK